jgi:hypothetical protein
MRRVPAVRGKIFAEKAVQVLQVLRAEQIANPVAACDAVGAQHGGEILGAIGAAAHAWHIGQARAP